MPAFKVFSSFKVTDLEQVSKSRDLTSLASYILGEVSGAPPSRARSAPIGHYPLIKVDLHTCHFLNNTLMQTAQKRCGIVQHLRETCWAYPTCHHHTTSSMMPPVVNMYRDFSFMASRLGSGQPWATASSSMETKLRVATLDTSVLHIRNADTCHSCSHLITCYTTSVWAQGS